MALETPPCPAMIPPATAVALAFDVSMPVALTLSVLTPETDPSMCARTEPFAVAFEKTVPTATAPTAMPYVVAPAVFVEVAPIVMFPAAFRVAPLPA